MLSVYEILRVLRAPIHVRALGREDAHGREHLMASVDHVLARVRELDDHSVIADAATTVPSESNRPRMNALIRSAPDP